MLSDQVPALQSKQSLELASPFEGPYVPFRHDVQVSDDVAPTDDDHDPALHVTQEVSMSDTA